MIADGGLLQEAKNPPSDVAPEVEVGGEAWLKHQFDRWCRVVRLSDRVRVEQFTQIDPISVAEPDQMPVSGIGINAAARIVPAAGEPFIAVSMYARWMRPHPATRSKWSVGFPDASAHRAISDLSAFIGHEDPGSHRILVAGDFSMNPDAWPKGGILAPARTDGVDAHGDTRLPILGAARRSDVPFEPRITRAPIRPVGPCLRVARLLRGDRRPRVEHACGMGRQRPLPPGDRRFAVRRSENGVGPTGESRAPRR